MAALHVAAVLDPAVENRRMQAWNVACTWNDVLAAMRRLYPHHDPPFVDDFVPADTPPLNLTTDLSLPLALLKKWYGQDGWRSLDDSVADELRVIKELEVHG